MAYETGTATNERDLLAKLGAFLTANPELVASGQNWRQLHRATIPATTTTVEQHFICWVAPGAGGADEIYAAAQTVNSISADIYNVTFAGGTWYEAGSVVGNDYYSGLRNQSPVVTLFADNREIRYWLMADGRRFILTTVVGSVYSTVYCGFILPAVPPTEYPYPLLIAGSASADTLRRYSDVSDAHSSIADPRNRNCWLLTPAQEWLDFYGRVIASGSTAGSSGRYMTPNGNYRWRQNVWPMLSGMGASPGGAYPLTPCELRSVSDTAVSLWGILDGVYWLPGMTRAAEDSVDVDGRTFLIFQSGHRTTTVDYFCVEVR